MPTPAKLNLRLPPDLKAQAETVASFHGLSLNALCVMALRSYVPYLARKSEGLAGFQAPALPAPSAPLRVVRQRVARGPVVALNAPCPCGSGLKFKRCCGRSGMA